MTETSWLSDPLGRVNNISLAPSPKNSLQPLFEAVMNSIQAIEERFGKERIADGSIEIEVIREDDGGAIGFIISDNGIGLNPENMESFRKADSRKKFRSGGKGVGRLLWLKVAKSIHIESIYDASGQKRSIEFDFCLHETDPIQNLHESETGTKIGTRISLFPYLKPYASEIPRKLDTIAVRTIAHFIAYFVNISSPRFVILDESDRIDLFDKFTTDFERDKDYPFEVELSGERRKAVLHNFLVPKNYSDDEKGTNAIFFGANGRAVKRFEMDAVLGLKSIDKKWAYFGYVESEVLNQHANDTRTDFSMSENDVDAIKREAIVGAKDFLREEIDAVRGKQIATIKEVRDEHLRFYNIARDPKEISENLDLSVQTKEDMFLELSRYSFRQYSRKKREFLKSKSKKLPDLDAKAKEYVRELKGESISSLAEYVYKRKLILDVFEDKAAFSNIEEEKTHYEKIVHELVCPLNSTKEDLNYEDHNLWLVDDRLSFYSYFNSDKMLSSQVAGKSEIADRPDITFFDLGIGFERANTSDPVTIIEFKRPKRDDYSYADNPFVQVQKYVEKLRAAKEIVRYDGKPLRNVDDSTPFMCHVIADITSTLRHIMKSFGGFYQKAGSGAFYKWDAEFKTFIEVTSYLEVIRSARARHEAFFDKLGIL